MSGLARLIASLESGPRACRNWMIWHAPPSPWGSPPPGDRSWWLARGQRCTIQGDPRCLQVCRGSREEAVAAADLADWLREEMPPGSEVWGVWDYESLLVLSGLPAAAGVEGAARLFVPERIEAIEGPMRGPGGRCAAGDASVTEMGADGAGVFRPSLSATHHAGQVERIRQAIAAGDVYEVNLTFEVAGPALDVAVAFPRMIRRNPAPHACCLEIDGLQVLSVSPELFFEVRRGQVRTRPMKGTRARSPLGAGHEAADRKALTESLKDRAENLMIVDLTRSDLRKICEPHSIEVTRLCEVEVHPRVLQMVSEIRGRLATRDLAAILGSLGPGGSMTGAPKWTATELIRGLEQRARGAYAGAIGRLEANGDMCWSMGIRLMEQREGRARIGCGGAVVWESTASGEWAEALVKARSVVEAAGGILVVES